MGLGAESLNIAGSSVRSLSVVARGGAAVPLSSSTLLLPPLLLPLRLRRTRSRATTTTTAARSSAPATEMPMVAASGKPAPVAAGSL